MLTGVLAGTKSNENTEREISASGESAQQLAKDQSNATIEVTVKRQKEPAAAPYEETFHIPYRPG